MEMMAQLKVTARASMRRSGAGALSRDRCVPARRPVRGSAPPRGPMRRAGPVRRSWRGAVLRLFVLLCLWGLSLAAASSAISR